MKYSCQYTHDLYLGTSLGSDGGTVNVSLDGAAASLKCYANITPGTQLVTRRVICGGSAGRYAHADHHAFGCV